MVRILLTVMIIAGVKTKDFTIISRITRHGALIIIDAVLKISPYNIYHIPFTENPIYRVNLRNEPLPWNGVPSCLGRHDHEPQSHAIRPLYRLSTSDTVRG